MDDDRTNEERGLEVILFAWRVPFGTDHLEFLLAVEKRTISSGEISLFKCGLLHFPGQCELQ